MTRANPGLTSPGAHTDEITTLSGSFPTTQQATPYLSSGITLADVPPGGSLGWNQWTPGAAAIVILQTQAPLFRPWTIVGWSLAYQLYRISFFVTGRPARGKLGRLAAGLIQGVSVPTGSLDPNAGVRVPWTESLPQPPQDPSMSQVLFDGATDASPPAASSSTPNTLAITPSVTDWRVASFQLPQPIVLRAGQQIGFGMWFTPSLTQNAGLLIMRANYSVNVVL